MECFSVGLLSVIACFAYVGLACDSKWLWNGEKTCYLLVNYTKENFEEAEDSCQRKNAHLLHLETKHDWEFLSSAIVNSSDIWLGLYRNENITELGNISNRRSGWHWSNGIQISWSQWFEGNSATNEIPEPTGISDCVIVNNHGDWYNTPCQNSSGYICQRKYQRRTTEVSDKSTLLQKITSSFPADETTNIPRGNVGTETNATSREHRYTSLLDSSTSASLFTESIETRTLSASVTSDNKNGRQQTLSYSSTKSSETITVLSEDVKAKSKKSSSLDPKFVLITGVSLVVVFVAVTIMCIIASHSCSKVKHTQQPHKSSTWPRRKRSERRTDLHFPGTNHTYASSLPVPHKQSASLSIEKKPKQTRQFESEYVNDPDMFPY